MNTEKAMQKIFEHLLMISYQNLHDRFEFDGEKLTRYYNQSVELLNQYRENKLSAQELLKYSVKIKVDSLGWTKTIPTSQKMKLSEFKAGKGNCKDIIKIIESAFLISNLLSISVLKEEFEMSKEDIDCFNKWQRYYIDSYCKGYLNDKLVNELIIEECGLDIIDYMEVMSFGK